jgi:hypothetical protein
MFSSFLKSDVAAKPAQQAGASTTRLAAAKDFRSGETRTALRNLTNSKHAAPSTSGKDATSGKTLKKSKISLTQSQPSKVNPPPAQEKNGDEEAPRRKSRLSITSRRKESRLSVSAMEIEASGVNQSVDMGDFDSSGIYVDEEEEEGKVEQVEVEEVTEAPIILEKEKLLLPVGCANIDELDENDPQWVTDYVNAIFEYLRENEVPNAIQVIHPWSTRFMR